MTKTASLTVATSDIGHRYVEWMTETNRERTEFMSVDTAFSFAEGVQQILEAFGYRVERVAR